MQVIGLTAIGHPCSMTDDVGLDSMYMAFAQKLDNPWKWLSGAHTESVNISLQLCPKAFSPVIAKMVSDRIFARRNVLGDESSGDRLRMEVLVVTHDGVIKVYSYNHVTSI